MRSFIWAMLIWVCLLSSDLDLWQQVQMQSVCVVCFAVWQKKESIHLINQCAKFEDLVKGTILQEVKVIYADSI